LTRASVEAGLLAPPNQPVFPPFAYQGRAC
jgi:hypothetical protein